MTQYDVKRLALILAIQADIEGMKASNLIRESNGMPIEYDGPRFMSMADELRKLAIIKDEEL
jgi:hypothetical protein